MTPYQRVYDVALSLLRIGIDAETITAYLERELAREVRSAHTPQTIP